MHAVAIEQNGGLVDVSPDTVDLRQKDDTLWLTFPVTSSNIQFEYYDQHILTRQNQTRQLDYKFTAPYNIETVTFEVQEPAQTQTFSLTPKADNVFTGRDGLTYHFIQITNLTPTDTFELSATYERDTDVLSAQHLSQNVGITPPSDVGTPVEPLPSENFNLGYLLIVGGVVLLLAAGGYWLWSQQKQAKPSPPYRRTPRPGHSRKAKSKTSVTAGGYCYRCGAALRDDANFCHNCGAERR